MSKASFLCFVGNVAQHIFHIAGEDAAQVVQRGGGDVAVLLQGVQRPPAEGIVLDERVGGEPLRFRVSHSGSYTIIKTTSPVVLLYFPPGGLNIPDISGIIRSE